MIKIRVFSKYLFAIGVGYLHLPAIDTTLYSRGFLARAYEGNVSRAEKYIEQLFDVKRFGNLYVAKPNGETTLRRINEDNQ